MASMVVGSFEVLILLPSNAMQCNAMREGGSTWVDKEWINNLKDE